MHTKLAGHLPLQDMIANVIEGARAKIAAAEGDEKDEKKVEKLVKYEKKEHGGKIPSVKEEEAEHKKEASAINFNDHGDIEKLAAALEFVSEKLAADSKNIGGESHQGGEVLPTANPPKGQQAYKHDSSKSHNVPMSTPMQGDPSQGKAQTQVLNDHAKAPGGPAYPAKGVLKTAEEKAEDKKEEKDEKKMPPFAKKKEEEQEKKASKVVSNIDRALAKMAGLPPALAEKAEEMKEGKKHEKGESKSEEKEEKKEEAKDKKASAVSFILSKLAESPQGGMTLDSKSGEGPKPEAGAKGGNDARSPLESNEAAINMKKVDGKKPQKRMLSEVLSEPAMSKAHDSKVHENLLNASKGGVKIAEAKALLQKIAEEGCTCSSKGECKYCKMKAAMEKKKESMGGGMSPPAPMTTPSGMSGSMPGTI